MSLLKSIIDAAAAGAALSDSTQLPWLRPKGQQHGQILYGRPTILSRSGNPEAYVPGTVPEGTRIRFDRSGRDYVVGKGGNLIRIQP